MLFACYAVNLILNATNFAVLSMVYCLSNFQGAKSCTFYNILLIVINTNPLIFSAYGMNFILNWTCFDITHVLTVSRLPPHEQNFHNRRQFIAGVQWGITWVHPDRRFMETAGARDSPFCIWSMALFKRITGFLESVALLPNGSSEKDSKSLNRQGHQKQKIMFLAALLKADNVCERIWRCLCCPAKLQRL